MNIAFYIILYIIHFNEQNYFRNKFINTYSNSTILQLK